MINKPTKRPFQTRCMKVVNKTIVNDKIDYIEICGKFIEGSRLISSHGLLFRLDLCEDHIKEYEKKEAEAEKKAKISKKFEKTDFKCPECGEPVFKYHHTTYGLYPEHRYFWCPNYCDLDCSNCINTDDESCIAFFCLHMSSWSPKKKEE